MWDDPRGSNYTLTYGYDGLDRRTGISAASSTVLSPITMTYDALGRRTSLSDGSGGGIPTVFTPDTLGRIIQAQAPNTGIIGYGYNARGERTRLTYPNSGPVIDYTYKPDGQLDQVLQGGTALATYQYDTAGRLQQLQRANGATTTYGYDGADRVKDILTTVNGSTVSDFAYTVDKLGLRTSVQETLPDTSSPTSSPTPSATATGATSTATRTTTTAPATATATATSAASTTSIPATATATATPTSTGSGSLYYTVNASTGAYLEAETYTSKVGPLFRTVTDVTRSNGQYVDTLDQNASAVSATNAPDYLTYDLEVTSGGAVNMYLLDNGPDGDSDSVWVTIDGQTDLQINATTNVWGWKKASSGTFSLPSGSHTLTIKNREDGAQLDRIYITTGSTAPTGLGGTALTPQYRGATATATSVPPTATATATSVPPTATATASTTGLPATATPSATSIPPSATASATAIPATATRTATATSVPPSATASATPIGPTATATRTATATSVPPSATASATATATIAPSATATIVPSATPTSTGSGGLYYAVDPSVGAYIEAETYTSKVGSLFHAFPDSSRSGGAGMETTDLGASAASATSATDYLTYDLHVTNGGTVNVYLLDNGPDPGSDSFWVTVDGQTDLQINATTNVWGWKKASTGTFSLPTGNHTLTIKNREDGAQVDKIYITTGSTAPTGLGGTALTPQFGSLLSGWLAASHPLQGTTALDGDGTASLHLSVFHPADAPAAPALTVSAATTSRTLTYQYDGLLRLSGATTSGGATATYSYTYDLGGNRTSATVNGSTTTRTYNAANQVVGWTYDNAGNLISDGTTTYGYDALNRQITTGGITNAYNGDGVLVQQGTTRYTQDLIAPLSQILGDGTQTYVYGRERLYGQAGTTKTWYASDALGSVRYTMDGVGTPGAPITYDSWGGVTGGSVPTFGFTGELQQGGLVDLRARWYSTSEGRFGSRDPFAGGAEQPYSLHPYQYGYSDPLINVDPYGQSVSSPNSYMIKLKTMVRGFQSSSISNRSKSYRLNKTSSYSCEFSTMSSQTNNNGQSSIYLDANDHDELGLTEFDRFADRYNEVYTKFWFDAPTTLGTLGLYSLIGTPVATAIGVTIAGVTLTIVLRDFYRILGMIQAGQRFLNTNGGGEGLISIYSDGEVIVETHSKQYTRTGYNYYRQSTQVTYAMYLITAKIMSDFP